MCRGAYNWDLQYSTVYTCRGVKDDELLIIQVTVSRDVKMGKSGSAISAVKGIATLEQTL